MNRVVDYIEAAERDNTRRSYASAIRHFEIEWKGLLPSTADAIARYLADYAPTLAINTLRQRLAALSRWHADQGFADPTKSPLVRQVLKGIRSIHAVPEKRARPLELAVLQQIDQWLDVAIGNAQRSGDRPALLRQTRNRSLMLLGFWRGFRSDELVNLRVENIEVTPGQGMACYLGRTKGDRQLQGRVFKCPALSRLCPVTAFNAWIDLAGLTEGPVFRKIDRWGNVADESLHADSLIPLLRSLFAEAGVESPEEYSSHSLRRGFAGWTRASGWDIKELMEYVGWKDVKSAMRYLDASDSSLQARFEQGLTALAPAVPQLLPLLLTEQIEAPRPPAEGTTPMAVLRVTLVLARFSKQSRGLARGHRLIEQTCFERFAMQRLNTEGTLYELAVPYLSRDLLDEVIATLLDDMYRIAEDNQCLLETSFHEPATDTYWD
ncbi:MULTISPECIES: site-specific integrase [Burkholderiales]|jgi:integrase|uniref:Site-specific integrase n=4 Tax=Burkholderiales TaxID=80840 RepID=A0AA42I2C4_9BURK|nr:MULTISPECIES: site-specific integrase [Burkholderiales]AVA33775.1 Tn3 family resolvase [Cupriavidus metallidurans]MBK9196924.1 site-specific integrase [Betaproteobacteria bacterium]MBK9392348.1 site-specific integrase [Uliginosibacterium sp.]MBP7965914.1 site-specific integrase [Burkholderiaceae bacterium]MDH0364710.1 site-specific integrase [Comamonas aquatica]